LWIKKAHHISLFAKYSGLHCCYKLKIPNGNRRKVAFLFDAI